MTSQLHLLVFLSVFAQIHNASAVCENRLLGAYLEADQEDICRYYKCEPSGVSHMGCWNTKWSQEDKDCVPLDEGESCQPSKVCEDLSSGYFVPDLSDRCRVFQCTWGVESNWACPSGQRWSQTFGQCIALGKGERCTPVNEVDCNRPDWLSCAKKPLIECKFDRMWTRCPHKCRICTVGTTTASVTTTTTISTRSPIKTIVSKRKTTTTRKPTTTKAIDPTATTRKRSIESTKCLDRSRPKYYEVDDEDICRFYKCEHGAVNHMACWNKKWSQEDEDCVPLDEGETCQPSKECEDLNSGYTLPDLRDKCRAVQCTWGAESNWACKRGHKWSQAEMQCVAMEAGETCGPVTGGPQCDYKDLQKCEESSMSQCKFDWMLTECPHKCRICPPL